jgi:addiction module HigA family antidote
MFNPPHPAELIRDEVLPALGLTVTQAARQLGVSRVTLSRVLNGRTAVSLDMAMRFEAWLKTPSGGGPTAEMFLKGQLNYDLWQAGHKRRHLLVRSVRRLAVQAQINSRGGRDAA